MGNKTVKKYSEGQLKKGGSIKKNQMSNETGKIRLEE